MQNRINSLLYQHKAKRRSSQQQSHSHSKKKKNAIDQSSQLFVPQHFITDFLTFPLSTEGQKTSRYLNRQLKPPIKKNKSKSKTKVGQKSKSLSSKQKKSKQKEKKQKDKIKKEIPKRHSTKGKKKDQQQKVKKPKQKDSINKFNSSKKLSPDCLSKTFKITRANSKQTKPYSTSHNYEEILDEYGDFLTISEIGEIKQYKNIYFLGKIKSRKNKKLFYSSRKTPNSAEQKMNKSSEKKEIIEISNMFTERKVNGNGLIGEYTNPDDQFYQYEIGDHIAYRYQIIQSINNGAFGEVVKVFDHKSKQLQALKIVKKSQDLVQQTFIQITILTQIQQHDKQNLSGIVKIKDFTIFRKHICIAFQLLEGNLYEFVASNNHCGLTENAIRIFAVQLLNSLSFLRQEKIIHCDIKPENIVMRKWGKSGIKLIDFGTSCFEGKQIYEYLQSRFYRSPQIILHKPYSYPIDMWSLGCILAELKMGEPLFPAQSDKQHLLYISKSIGIPSQFDGQYSSQFYQSEQIQEILQKYYLDEYELIKDKQQVLRDHPFFSKCKYLKMSMKTLYERINHDNKNQDFLKFISKILVWEPQKRLKPQDALQQPWITQGIPKEVKQIYTFFTSRQKSKQSKHKKTPQKSKSKSKSLGKKQKNKTPRIKAKYPKQQKQTFTVKQRQKSLQLPSKRPNILTKKERRCIF